MQQRILQIILILNLLGCAQSSNAEEVRLIKTMPALHKAACAQSVLSKSVWRISHLYDCGSRELFIPYQLWTGAKWSGNKIGECMHSADSFFNVDGDSETTIKGPDEWKNPRSGKEETVWVRAKVNGSKVQYFTCHDKGIGRVYDSRRPKYYPTGRCKFPAGFGWKVKKRRSCNNTSIQITELGVDGSGALTHIKFKWWVVGILDHVYRYIPDYGMTDAWEQ